MDIDPAVDLRDTVSHSGAASTRRDARAVRSAEALEAAFLALLERKPLDQITVREIAGAAGVHYATFFRHHPTKEALLDHLAAAQIARLVALTIPVLDRADTGAATLALCRYVADHRRLWATLLTGGAAAAMRAELLRISGALARDRAPPDPAVPVELGVACSVTLLFETLAWWLAQPADAVPVADAAAILGRLLSAIEASL